jgi:thymidine phosphorylase
MDARSLIAKLRNATELTEAEAHWIGLNLAGPEITDAQVGALAMAISINGMNINSRVALTNGMCESGDVLTWDLPGPILDKHSTGGVGDPVSLLLAPALAACGAYVPMISGRGLGHTGGTLDKLEAIPGYICNIGPKRLNHVLSKVGCAIVGAGGRVAPSDKRLYEIRDVTGTVKSIDLITASILSKKLAAGLDGLVLDVKTGSGAFMQNPEDARKLAKSLVEVANGAGCCTSALITDMSQPLANAAGNAVEIRSVMSVLTGESKNERLHKVICGLGGELLAQSDISPTPEIGAKLIAEKITSGAAAEVFGKMVAELGGPLDFEDNWKNCLPEAPVQREVTLGKPGYIAEYDTLAIGEAVVSLGGGRLRESDRVNHAVGISQILPLGQVVDRNTPIAMVHAQDEMSVEKAISTIKRAVKLQTKKPDDQRVILEVIRP